MLISMGAPDHSHASSRLIDQSAPPSGRGSRQSRDFKTTLYLTTKREPFAAAEVIV
jgi:hypothetical protein